MHDGTTLDDQSDHGRGPRAEMLELLERVLSGWDAEGRWLLETAREEYLAQAGDGDTADRLEILMQVLEFYLVGEPGAWLRAARLLEETNGAHRPGGDLTIAFHPDLGADPVLIEDLFDTDSQEQPFVHIESNARILRQLRSLYE